MHDLGTNDITAIAVGPSVVAAVSGREISESMNNGVSWCVLATANDEKWSLGFLEQEKRSSSVADLARCGVE